MRKLVPLFVAVALSMTTPLHAEVFGMQTGRSVAPTHLPDLSVEGGLVLGDNSYQYYGARFNYRATPKVMAYGDVGRGEGEDDLKGTAFGVGAFYFVDTSIVANTDFALKASFHRGNLKSGDDKADVNAITFEGVLSGRTPLSVSNDISWYANLGIHRYSYGGDSSADDNSELGFGAGIYGPAGPGEFYAGAELIDDLFYGVGYRYFLK